MFNHNNFKITKNNYGVMHKMNPISKAFVEFAKSCDGFVLDIGSAYGIATIPVLSQSEKTKVIACDISKNHLEDLSQQIHELEMQTGKNLSSRLTLMNKEFPKFELEENSLDAVLVSHVLPFLTGCEITEGFRKLAKFIKPGGRLYITSYSIYNKLMERYIPIYEKKKHAGDPWPGELQDASLYWNPKNPLTAVLPKRLNHLEPCLIESLLKVNNFQIKYLDFLPSIDEIPEDIKLDGREAMGLIAEKIKIL